MKLIDLNPKTPKPQNPGSSQFEKELRKLIN
jgi:hypothetical protein